jgi:uncharacterized protein YjbI with pentapeptide repeats
MYTPIHALRQSVANERRDALTRWDRPEGHMTYERVIELIDAGAGEDFLQADWEHGNLPILDDMWDLRGLKTVGKIWDFDKFPPNDTFESIDFSFGSFYNCVFKGAYFSSQFRFASLELCRFINCTFQFTYFYGADLENVRFEKCDFIEGDDIVNCRLSNASFTDCFYASNLFSDCSFSRDVVVQDSVKTPTKGYGALASGTGFLPELFRSIKEAYSAGGAFDRSRDYYYRQMETVARYQATRKRDKLLAWAFSVLAGYGVRPLRVLRALAILYLAVTVLFLTRFDFASSLLLAAGGIFTFGARSDLLTSAPLVYSIIYVISSFAGITLTALFVTVLTAVFLRER